MKLVSSALLLSLLFLVACATRPAPLPEDFGAAINNSDVGHYGYRLPIYRYFPVASDQIEDFPVLQAWLRDWRQRSQEPRVREYPTLLLDDHFLYNGERFIRFSVEELRSDVPFNRLSLDRRERLLRGVASYWQARAERRGWQQDWSYETVGGKPVLRGSIIQMEDAAMVHYAVLGRLNEIFHFTGLGGPDEGEILAAEIEAMIAGLVF
jgi:hypothetical protein